MFSFCVIPYSVRSNAFFNGVYEDGVRVRYDNDVIKPFAFTRVLSPSHDLLTNINSRLLQNLHENKNVMLIFASSHCVNSARHERNELVLDSENEETNFNTCSSISASTSEISTMCLDLCLDLFTHLFDRAQCKDASATVTMTTIFSSGTMVDELRLCQESVDSTAECTVKEINKANAATQWAFILQRLQQRHNFSTFSHNKNNSSHESTNEYEQKCKEITKPSSVCVITICLSHSCSITIVDVDDDVFILEQLARVVAHKVCNVASASSVHISFNFSPERAHSLSTVTRENCKENCTRFMSLLEIVLSGKMHNKEEIVIDKYDVVHTVAFANPLVSLDGTLAIIEFTSKLNSSPFWEEKVKNYNSLQSEKPPMEGVTQAMSKISNGANSVIFDKHANYKKCEENENSNVCKEDNIANYNNDESTESYKNENEYIKKTNYERNQSTEDISYHHSLPLTESPLSSLSPPPFVTQFERCPKTITMSHNNEWEANNNELYINSDNEAKAKTDTSYGNTKRRGQLLSPSPFVPSSSPTSFSSTERSILQRGLSVSNETKECSKKSSHDENGKKVIRDKYVMQNYVQEDYNSNNDDNTEEFSVHLDSDTNADNEEPYNNGESNARYQSNETNDCNNVTLYETSKAVNRASRNTSGIDHEDTLNTTSQARNLQLEQLMQKTNRDLMELREKYAPNNSHETSHRSENYRRPYLLHTHKEESDQVCNIDDQPSSWQTRFMQHQLRLLEYERQQMQLSKETNEEDAATRESELRILRERVHMLENALISQQKSEQVEAAKAIDKNGSHAAAHITTSPPSPAAIKPVESKKSEFRKSLTSNNSCTNVKQSFNNSKVKLESQFCVDEGDGDDQVTNNKRATDSSTPVVYDNEELSCYKSKILPQEHEVPSESSPSSLFPYLQTPSLSLSQEINCEYEPLPKSEEKNRRWRQHQQHANLQERIAAIGIHELRRRNAELWQKIALLENEVKKREQCRHTITQTSMQNESAKELQQQQQEPQEQQQQNKLGEDNDECWRATNANVRATHINATESNQESHALHNMCINTQSIASSMLASCQLLVEELNVTREKLLKSEEQTHTFRQSYRFREQELLNERQMRKRAMVLIDEHIRALSCLELAITNIANKQVNANDKALTCITNENRTNTNESVMQPDRIDNLFAFEEQRVRCFRNFLPVFVHVCTAAKHVKFRV